MVQVLDIVQTITTDIVTDIVKNGDTGFSPLDLPNLVLWCDASDVSSITKDISNKVSQWNDKSGNANHAVQLTGVAQPTFVPNAQNGLSGLSFNGSNFFSLTNTLTLSGAYTVFQVTELTTPTNQLIGGSLNSLPVATTGAFAFYNYADQGGSFAKVSTTLISAINVQVASRTSAGVHSFLLDGVDDTFASANDNRSIDFTLVGRRALQPGVTGDVDEIFICATELSSEEIQSALNYLTRWGI